MNLINILSTHFQHGHFPVFFGAVTGAMAIIPIIFYFISVTRTFFNKLHTINGLRRYRVFLMVTMISIILAHSLLIYYYIYTFFNTDEVQVIIPSFFIIVNSIGGLLLAWLSWFLFRHASKKED